MDNSSIQDIDRCCCGAHQAIWSAIGYPATSRHTYGTHSPVGCFRVGGTQQQVEKLYHELTGLWPVKMDYWPVYQAVCTKLKERPDLCERERVVVTPVPFVQYCPVEKPSPTNDQPRARSRRWGTSQTSPANPPTWDPLTQKIKPPWIKDG